jgi:hypothetical protein
MKHITKMWEIEDGKRYFVLQVQHGEVKTGIVKAEVKYQGHPIATQVDILFVIQSGDITPGPFHSDFIAEIE